jgi:hypothetical protein
MQQSMPVEYRRTEKVFMRLTPDGLIDNPDETGKGLRLKHAGVASAHHPAKFQSIIRAAFWQYPQRVTIRFTTCPLA